MDRKHLVWMIVGCSVPVVALALLPRLMGSGGGALALLLFLVCPAVHLIMMRGMPGQHDHGQHARDETKADSRSR